jgi:hypothetical protein
MTMAPRQQFPQPARIVRVLDRVLVVIALLALAPSLLCFSLVHLNWPRLGFEAGLVLMVYSFLAGAALVLLGAGAWVWRLVAGGRPRGFATLAFVASAILLAVAAWVAPMAAS